MEEGQQRIRDAYGIQEVRPASRTLKHGYDPDNFFRMNQNITGLVRCRWKEGYAPGHRVRRRGARPLQGWLHLPDEAGGPVPTVVMAGLSAVKEMFLDSFPEAFAAGAGGAGRQPQLRRQRRRAAPGDRPWARS